MAIALAAVALAGIAILVGRTHDANAPLRGPERADAPASAHDAPLATPSDPARSRQPERKTADAARAAADQFAGRGRVRGEIVAAAGVALPKEWTLVLEPHPWLRGSEHAVRKRMDFANGESTFDSGEVPLAGYRVRAEAPALNSTDATVLLVVGSADVFVTLELRGSGMIDGRVFAADGSPAEGLDVVLEPKGTSVRLRTTVGANGLFVFGDVLDGEYRLWLGPPEAPFFPSADIVFRAPSLRYPDHTLPPMGAIALLTVDERGLPVGDVEVTGFGSPKGAVRITTGADGRALVRWLLPGTYRLEGRSADGRRGKETLEVRAGEQSHLTLHLKQS